MASLKSLILVLNPGSASKKLGLYSSGGALKLGAHVEREGDKIVATLTGAAEERFPLPESGLEHATDWFLGQARSAGILEDSSRIEAVALRIVASGEAFRTDRVIDEHYERQLRAAYARSPLHLGPALTELEHVRGLLGNAKVVGVSDSAFHRTLPELARRYAIPAGDAERRGLFRYGFHGISMAGVTRTLRKHGGVPARTVVLHLGSGSSATALLRGKSVETSMGATPLEGLVMSTRSGDVDPGILLEMAAERSARQVETDINRHSGLLALGGSSDVRQLLEKERKGDSRAAFALDAHAYRIRKYVGAYAAVLGGLDALVFTGTIGERSWPVRKRVTTGLEYLGIKLDTKRNRATNSQFAEIGAGKDVRVIVVPTDEDSEMARAAAVLANR